MRHVPSIIRTFIALSPQEISMCLAGDSINVHHDDEGHGIQSSKNFRLPWLAERAFEAISKTEKLENCVCVDEWMKVYCLREGGGGVAQHTDMDFKAVGLFARWSVLIYLNEDFEGGETVFETDKCEDHPRTGEIIAFPHNLLHEGKPVTKGIKYVVKTDLLFSL